MKPLLRLLYTVAVYLATPVILMYLAWRGLRHRAYWQRWRERLGYLRHYPPAGGIWVHAVSVGEVNGVLPLVRQLQQAYPGRCIVFTCATPTGSQRICDIFKPQMLGAQAATVEGAEAADSAVYHCYLPLDLPGALKRLFAQLKPSLLVVMETEIWPNLFFCAQQHDVPTVVVNARLSQRSADGYRRFLPQARMALQSAAAIVAQTEADARRFIAAGAHPDAVTCSGNLKGDVRLPADVCQRAYALQRQWDGERVVWMGASTHEGEEAALLATHRRLLQVHACALLILVPRHPERFASVGEMAAQTFTIQKRSELNTINPDTQVVLGDTMGEMMVFFGAGDAAFVGGSLIEHGGHNVLEPASWAIPVLSGPYVHNFKQICEQMVAQGALINCSDESALGAELIELAMHESLRDAYGAHAKEYLDQNRGSLERQYQAIIQL